MIKSMHIENFKCFKDFNIELGPFNVLIGPNDTGKTAFLQAVRLIGAYAEMPDWEVAGPGLADIAGASPPLAAAWQQDASSPVAIEAHSDRIVDQTQLVYELAIGMPSGVVLNYRGTIIKGKREAVLPPLNKRMRRPEYYRFSPSSLRVPSPLAQEMSETGEGLAAFMDNINRHAPEVFKAIQKAFCSRFDYYTKVEVVVVKQKSNNVLALKFHAKSGQVMEASLVSDGVMLSLAFMAIAHQPKPPKILLIEEPENGVHHASLKDIVATLKQLSKEKGVQVILTTHSPYLLDHVESDEVHVFTKDDEGAVHTGRLSDHPDVEDLKKHFGTGEIWTGFDSDKDIVEKTGKFE